MNIEELRKSQKRIFFPSELKLAADGSKTIWRMPDTGEIVTQETEGAKGYRRFWAMISTERKDRQKTIVTRNAAVASFIEWMEAGGGNVRFMHNMDPVGRIFAGDYEIQEAGVYAGFSIPIEETETIKKIDNGLIRFVSIGFDVDWQAENPFEILTDGTMVFHRIILAEISIGDFGATPGTNIVEERAAEPEDLTKKIYHMVTAMFKKTNPGVTPEPTKLIQEDEQMTPEQLKALQDTLEAGFTRMTERLGALPKVQEPQPAPGTDNIEKRITDAVMAAVKPLNDQIADLKRLTTTTDPMTATLADVEQDIVKMEALVEELKKQGPGPNQRLSFIKKAGTGTSLTINDLTNEGDE